MAESRKLDEVGLQSAERLLNGLVTDSRPLSEELRNTRSIHEAINAVGLSSASSTDNRQRLSLISSLNEAAAGDLELAGLFWNDLSIKTLRDAAKRYSILSGRANPDLSIFQMRLFALDPTATLYSMVVADKIVLQPNNIKPAILQIFEFALSKDFNIGKEPIENILNASEVQKIVSGQNSELVQSFFRNLQRLQALVRLPEDVACLMKSPYASAQQIAHTPRKSFVTAVAQFGLSEDSAVSIHDHATTVDARNEQAWTALLASKSQTSLAAIAGFTNPPGTVVPASQVSPASKQVISYSNLFGDIVIGSCDDCASVTGPAAYFVDLLRMLKNAPSNPSNLQSPSLLDKLLSRRPDLKRLELSCSNTNVLIPYVDLANEAMESFIKNLGTASSMSPIPIQAFNMDDQDTSEDRIAQAQETDYSIYRQQIASQMFPLTTFPYNQAVDLMRSYLQALGSSRFEILSLFGSKYRLNASQTSLPSADTVRTFKEAEEVLSNARAAEYLNLQHADYVATTGNSFFSLGYFKQTENAQIDLATYSKQIGVLSTGEYWGFASKNNQSADQIMISEQDGQGLPYVKDQLLPRAAISVQELLDVLKSRFLGGQLVLENIDNSATFSGNLQDLRLRHPTKDKSNGPLATQDCNALQTFLRLWRKTSWSISDLDCALACFGVSGLTGSSLPRVEQQTINALAAVHQISTLTGIEISRLIPLWGIIDTDGDKSLYARLFLHGKSNKSDPVFGKNDKGRFLDNNAKLSEHRTVLLATFRLSVGTFDAILTTAKIEDDALNLPNLSAIYRISLFCRILDINPVQYGGFLSLLGDGASLFKDPQTTLDIITGWQKCTENGLSIDQVLFITGKDADPGVRGLASDFSIQQVVSITSAIITGLINIQQDLPVVEPDSTISASEVAKISAMLFDPATAPGVAAFIEGSSAVSAEEKSAVYQNVLLKYFAGKEDQARNVFFDQNQPTGTAEEIAIALEQNLNKRRSFFAASVLPSVKSRLTNNLVINTLSPLFPDLDAALLRIMASDIIRIADQQTPALEVLSILLTSNISALSHDSAEAFFKPLSTDTYCLFVPDPQVANKPTILLDGTALMFEQGKQGWVSNELRLLNGQAYHLQRAGGNLADCSYSTQRSPSQPFTSNVLICQSTLDTGRNALRAISRSANSISTFKLNLDEVLYMKGQKPGTALAVDFNRLSYSTVKLLQEFSTLRDRLNSSESLLDLFKWIDLPQRDGSLAKKLSVLSALPELQIQEFLDAKYTKLTPGETIQLFRRTSELNSLLDSMAFVSRVGVPGLTLKSLFKWATPVPPPFLDADFENAADLRLLAQSIPTAPTGDNLLAQANNRLRNNQRTALVSYLLQQDYLKQRGISDADSLFEFFLIDVQMGACLQTSRIKQAISTIQLYIQRCILGLEKAEGVASGTINMDRWKWMQKYRLWEANRKVFLYPENWLDPTLRDDKTEVFQALESSILQNDLNPTSLVDQVKKYIYDTDAVADLDVQAYVWDKVKDYSGTFHFFARTRTAPYIYYYRSLEIVESEDSGRLKTFWKPWTKIDVDVPVQEVDADGKLLPVSGSYLTPALYGRRLFLFLPQITLKTTPSPTTAVKPMQTIGNQSPNDNRASKYWQVQIGWTEYRNGRWSPKQISQATLVVKGAQDGDFPLSVAAAPSAQIWTKAQEFPQVSSFKFWIRSRPNLFDSGATNILVIDVERWIDAGDNKTYLNYPLGRFEMRGPQLVLADIKSLSDPYKTPWKPTVPTVFAKLPWHVEDSKGSTTPGIAIGRGTTNEQPLLGIVPPPSDTQTKRDVKWTMSFNDSRLTKATGLVQDVATTESTISYFTYPPISSTTTFAADIFQHALSPGMVEMSTTYDSLDKVYAYLANAPESAKFLAFGKRNGAVHELSTPYAVYNWELGAHIIMLLMERLQATQQYDLALEIAHFAFDPTIDSSSLDRCWLFPPFKDLAKGRIDSIEDILNRLQPSSGAESEMRTNIIEWRKAPFNTHVIARGRPLAYMKRIVMKYIEILIASGDEYFRQNTLEAIPFAIQRYVEASHVYGAAPQAIPKLAKPKYKSYADLETTFNDFSNAAFDMELDFPFFSDPASRGTIGTSNTFSLTGILKSTYFCVPPNPRLAELRNLIDDRLFKIRNCQDINGLSRSLALFEPPIDPGMLVRAAAKGISLSELFNDTVGPMPNYRFVYLLQKTFEMCGELKSIGALFLSVREKKDAEALSNLRAHQDKVIQALTIGLKEMAKREAEKTIVGLEETRKGQVSRLMYYLALTGEQSKGVPGENSDWEDLTQSIEQPTTDDLRMTSNEKLEMDKAGEAAQLNQKATIVDITASILKAIPDISEQVEPLGVGVSIGSITANLSDALQISASVMRYQAQARNDEGARASRKSGLIRQLQERRMQANMAGRDIKGTDKQIDAMRVRLEMCERDIKLQQQQVAHATEMEDWLKNKYTGEQLYAWMDGTVRNLFYQTYVLANDLAKKAQKAFRFERGDQATDFIEQGYWDSGRDGLMSGENLFLALKRLEAAYVDKDSHDFEVVKNVSLRQVQPWALISLRETSTAEFTIPEEFFDFDFPGQYCRRIKSVSMSIPCIVGPYTGVNATLTLLEHRYRIKGDAKSGQDYPQNSLEDDRFRTDQIPISSIAVSHGQQDSGAFALNFSDERYIPFEGAGAISKWRIELPTAVKQFDYNSISDVVLHMRYTTLAGGVAFRKAASDSARSFQNKASDLAATEGIFAVFDLKNDFATEWSRFINSDKTQPATMPLQALQDRLPFFTRARTVKAESISVLVSSSQKIDMTKDISLTAASSVPLKAGTNIGTYQVGMAAGLDEKVGDWNITLTVDGMKAGVQRIAVLIRYTLS